MLIIILGQNGWILMETALLVQIKQNNWYIFSMNVTITKYVQEKTAYIIKCLILF